MGEGSCAWSSSPSSLNRGRRERLLRCRSSRKLSNLGETTSLATRFLSSSPLPLCPLPWGSFQGTHSTRTTRGTPRDDRLTQEVARRNADAPSRKVACTWPTRALPAFFLSSLPPALWPFDLCHASTQGELFRSSDSLASTSSLLAAPSNSFASRSRSKAAPSSHQLLSISQSVAGPPSFDFQALNPYPATSSPA